MTSKPLNLNLLAAHLSINAPHYRNSRFYNFPRSKELEELFPRNVSHADEDDRHLSVFSPAAYFYDLERLLDNPDPDHPTRPTLAAQLRERRPDLWDLRLDQEHAEELVPFLEIVNAVMSTRLQHKVNGGLVFTPQSVRRTDGGDWKADHYRPGDYITVTAAAGAAPDTDTAAAIDAAAVPSEPNRGHFGPIRTVTADLIEIVSAQFTPSPAVDNNAFVCIDVRHRMATGRFPLQMSLHSPLAEIRAYLGHAGIGLVDIYRTFELPVDGEAAVAETLGLSPFEFDRLTAPAVRYPERGGPLYADRFVEQAGLTADEFGEFLHVLGLALIRHRDGRQSIDSLDSDNLPSLHRFVHLSKRIGWSFSDLDLALQSIRIAIRIDGSHADRWRDVETPGTNHWPQSLLRLARIKRLSEKYKLPVEVVCGFEYLLDTSKGFAAPGKLAPVCLFDRVFNTTPFYHPPAAKYDRPVFHPAYHPRRSTGAPADWDTEMLEWDSTSHAQRDQGIRGSLLAALRVSHADLQAIVDHGRDVGAWSNPANISLNLTTLTRLYRYSKFAHVLGMQIPDYLLLLRCIARADDPYLKVAEVRSLSDLQVVDDWASWLKEAGLSAVELRYLSGDYTASGGKGPFESGASADRLAPLLAGPKPLQADSFCSETISAAASACAFSALQRTGKIGPAGLQRVRVDHEQVVAALQQYETPMGAEVRGLLDTTSGGAGSTCAICAITEVLNLQPIDPNDARTVRIMGVAEAFHCDPALVAHALDCANLQVPYEGQALTESCLRNLALLLNLAQAFNLSAKAFAALLGPTSPMRRDTAQPEIRFSLQELRTAHEFSKLVAAFETQGRNGQGSASDLAHVITKLTVAPAGDYSELLSSITGWWKSSQIKPLQDLLAKSEPGTGRIASHQGFAKLAAMQRCFDLAAKLNVDIDLLLRLCALPAQADTRDSFDGYRAAAHSLLGALKSKYPRAEWEKAYAPLRNRLNESARDGLAAMLLADLNDSPKASPPGRRFETLQDLSEYLLIDVEMTGCAQTSYVKAAIGCMQTYIERCRMHLEKDEHGKAIVLSSAFPDKDWAWMGNYRMWEANRKVFFYPENYLEPSLRRKATPQFKELQSQLLQGEVTQEAAEAAYLDYFDKLDELASLQIIGGHVAMVRNAKTGRDEETVFIVGRSGSEPPAFHYRSAVLDRTKNQFRGWRPWEKIELSIPSKSAVALYAFNRLYIFWIETTEKREPQDKDGLTKRVTTKATVKYSYQKTSGRWMQPQIHPESEKSLSQQYTVKQDGTLDGSVPSIPSCAIGPPAPAGALPNTSLEVRLEVRLEEPPKGNQDAKAVWTITPRPQTTSWLDDLSQQDVAEKANDPLQATLRMIAPAPGVTDLGDAGNYALATPNGSVMAFAAAEFTLYAVDYESGNVYARVSDQENAKWKIQDGLSMTRATAFTVTPREDEIYAADGGRVVCFVRNGKAWAAAKRAPEPKLPVETRITSLSRSRLNLFAGTPKGAFMRGVDSSWQSLDKSLGLHQVTALAVIEPNGLDGPETIIAATEAGICVTEVNHVGWRLTIKGLPEGNVTALAVTPRGTLIAAVSGQRAVYKRRLGDEQSTPWQVQALEGLPDMDITALAITPPGDLLVGTRAGVLLFGRKHVTTMVERGDDDFLVRSLGAVRGTVGHFDAPATLGRFEATEYTVQRLTTQAIHQLRDKVVTGGLDSLLSLPSQTTALPSSEYPSATVLLLARPDGTEPKYQKPQDQPDFDLGDPYAIYLREIFFHIPFLIADALNGNQQFEDARKWYHYIVDPTRPESADTATPADDDHGKWRYLPFRGHSIEKIKAVLNDEAHHDELNEDAFDPHAIAQTRLGAYEKAVAMKYIDNLLDWGDMLYAQDSWEGSNHAVLLYFNALNLLGPKPKPALQAPRPSAPQTTAVHHTSTITLDALSPDSSAREPFDGIPDFFSLPENDQFAQYWDRAQDRLYKIRHCMNAKGVVRQLALFDPPIDPGQLVRGLAAGQSLPGPGAVATPAVPHYRFSVVLQQAKSLTATVIQLGSALLAAREKKDGEDLNLLRSVQEQAILKMTRAIKERQITDGASHLKALEHSFDAAKARALYYTGLIDGGHSDEEKASLVLEAGAGYLHSGSMVLNYASIPGHAAPVIAGMAIGGMQPGHAIAAGAQAFASGAAALQTAAGMAATIAQYKRRNEDWNLQKSLATFDGAQIQAEIDGANVRLEMLKHDLDIHDQSVAQARERDEFYSRKKFGNSDLYQWMAGRLGEVYFSTYKLALEMARSAERAYQYERDMNEPTIAAGNWDSLRSGLLAGEGLMLGLHQLEKAYTDDDERALEIEKTLSLRQHLAGSSASAPWPELTKDGRLEFSLDERLFDNDFPGHYCRKIKSIAITIPAVVGPYQNVLATLRQNTNRVLLTKDIKGVEFLLGRPDGPPTSGAPTSIRADWRAQQQIAISKGVNDSGLFELNFRDERYLPFEGTGAVSDWVFEMPRKAVLDSVSDVIIHLRYTARDGGDDFRKEVSERLLCKA